MIKLEQKRSTKTLSAIIVAFSAWFAVFFQWYLMEGSLINFLSYFTITTNLLIAFSLTISVFFPKTKAGLFFSDITVETGITLYILIVGLVYNVVLRGILIVEGWQVVVDNILHVINPILYILYWILFSDRIKINWKTGIYWTFYPLAYLFYSLARGSIVNWYPYPFLNVDKFGYEKVFINVIVMIVLFFVFGILLIATHNKFRVPDSTSS
ncbi:hypothetical protein B4N84_15105 [Flavobacterium sp. IR1]|nr:hypothetical protein B4N84_15105 [Flavobacterium sp. IR1]